MKVTEAIECCDRVICTGRVVDEAETYGFWITVKRILSEYYDRFGDVTSGEEIFPCDPSKNTECRKTGCYAIGGPCRYTSHKEYEREWKE